MDLSRGDVVIIVLAGDLGKPRPAIVVQANRLNRRDTLLVCPLSSEIDATHTIRPTIEPTERNGLRVRSQVMVERLTTVRRERIRRVMGHLSEDDGAALDSALLFVLGLDGG